MLPFEESNQNELFKKIKKAEYQMPGYFSADAKDLVNSILVPDPKKRLSIASIKAHPWFKL